MSTQSLPRHSQQPAGIVVVLTVLVAVMRLAFAWPAARSKPHHLPIGLVGPPTVTGQIQGRIAPGGFAVTPYRDEAALRSAILHRDAYGGLVVERPGPALLVASGASPTVAALLTQIGARLAASALPLTVAGLLPATVAVLAFGREVWLRFCAIVVFSLLAALTIAALLRDVLGSFDHNFADVAAGLTLGALAMGLSLPGLRSLFGRIGLAVGVATAILVLTGWTAAAVPLVGASGVRKRA